MRETLEVRGAVSAAPLPRGVRLSEIRDVGKIDLRGQPGDKAFMGAVGRTLDLLLPTERCQSAAQGDFGALWIGPNQWLITSPKADVAETASKLDDAIKGLHGSVTDISSGRAVLQSWFIFERRMSSTFISAAPLQIIFGFGWKKPGVIAA